MRKLFYLIVFVSAVSLVLQNCSYAQSYEDTLEEAIGLIEAGAYDEAAPLLDRALDLDNKDSLVHAANGVLYMHTSRLTDARREFKQALSGKADDWRIRYALGLIAIFENRKAEADGYFKSAEGESDSHNELAALYKYLTYVGVYKRETLPTPPKNHLLVKQVDAIDAFNKGDLEKSRSLFKDVLRAAAPPGFEEIKAPLVTFDPKQPVALPQGKITWKPPYIPNAAVLSGVSTIRADISKLSETAFVTFSVDNVTIGITNYFPYKYDWNTLDYTNGLHQVRVEAKDNYGKVISSKQVWVRVLNDVEWQQAERSGYIADKLWGKLWGCMRLGESRRLAHFYIARAYLREGEKSSGIAHLHYALAYDADFNEARKLLISTGGRNTKYREMHCGRPDASGKKIALTFDDGPNERTQKLLDVLAELNVKATFFLVGSRAEAQPELVKKIVASGHQIENHSYTHPNLVDLDVDNAESELAKCAAVILAITDRPSLYFRPPGGNADQITKKAAARQGLTGVFWTVNCSPYEGKYYEQLAEHVISNASDGGIILMHNGEPSTVSALPRIVNGLSAQGYRFVTISEMDGR